MQKTALNLAALISAGLLTACGGTYTDSDDSSPVKVRSYIEAVLWIVRTGSPWRDLPREFGKWNSVFRRYRRRSKAGRFTGIFAEISGETDREYAMVDGTIGKVHRHGQGAKGGPGIRP